MKRNPSRSMIFLMIALLFCVALLISLMPVDLPAYSSESTKQNGTKALYLLLEKQGVSVDRLTSRYSLPTGAGHVLNIVAPEDAHKYPYEVEELKDWAERGNTIVLWAYPGHSLLGEFGITGFFRGTEEEQIQVEPSAEKWLQEIEGLTFPSGHRVGTEVEPILTDQSGDILIGKIQLGEGNLFYVPDPNFITNAYIDQQDNLAVPLYFTSLAEQGVWFDEALLYPATPSFLVTEDGKPTLWGLLAPAKLALVEALLLILFWLYYKGKRFAAPRWEGVAQIRNADEYVVAMAGMYQAAGLKSEVLEIKEQAFRRKTTDALGLSPDASYDQLVGMIRGTVGEETAMKARGVIQALQKEKETPLGSKKLIRLSQQMEEVREEIERWKMKR